MSISMATERSLVSHEEFERVLQSHYPLLEDASHGDLVELAKWLRARHNRARDIIRARRRVASGKVEARGTAAESASERGLAGKKQVFANALRRVNGRLARMLAARRKEEAHARLVVALERKRAAAPHHPQAGFTSAKGLRVKANATRRRIIQGARIGSVSQAGRDRQAARDNRVS